MTAVICLGHFVRRETLPWGADIVDRRRHGEASRGYLSRRNPYVGVDYALNKENTALGSQMRPVLLFIGFTFRLSIGLGL